MRQRLRLFFCPLVSPKIPSLLVEDFPCKIELLRCLAENQLKIHTFTYCICKYILNYINIYHLFCSTDTFMSSFFDLLNNNFIIILEIRQHSVSLPTCSFSRLFVYSKSLTFPINCQNQLVGFFKEKEKKTYWNSVWVCTESIHQSVWERTDILAIMNTSMLEIYSLFL